MTEPTPPVPLAPLPTGPVSRVAFLGTPDVAVVTLRALVDAGVEVALVITRPDARRGRGTATSPSPVKAAAAELDLPVTHDLDALRTLDVPLGVVVAFGQLIRRPVLERLPMVNLHLSLLPRWRGAAPVERALLAGDDVTGVCLMQLEEGLDTGPVLGCIEQPITASTTAADLRQMLAQQGSTLLVEQLTQGLATPRSQVGEATYAAKIAASDLIVDWTNPLDRIDRVVRVGGASTTFRGRRLRIIAARPGEPFTGSAPQPGTIDAHQVATDTGWLVLVEVQPEGKRPMPAGDWIRGARPVPGERLGYGDPT